jgi:hypothetical protein
MNNDSKRMTQILPDEAWLLTCYDCGETLGLYDDLVSVCEESSEHYAVFDYAHTRHQAEALVKAGFSHRESLGEE